MKNAMNGQVLTKNPLFLPFLMRKIKRRTFTYNRKGEKAKPLFKNIFNYSITIFFCPLPQACHINDLNAIFFPNLYKHLFMSGILFASK